MATNNVFGIAVTQGTRVERATKALNDPNAGGKRNDAISYLKSQHSKLGTVVSTLCMFYNATGETLRFSSHDSLRGDVYGKFPQVVQNGQWGAFMHAQHTEDSSIGFVVYRGKYTDTTYCMQLLAWKTLGAESSTNLAYCEIVEDGSDFKAEVVYNNMDRKNEIACSAVYNEMYTTNSNGDGAAPVYEATLTIEDPQASNNS